jgi:hypothetical protein
MSHRIHYALRFIAPADLPTTTDIGSDTPRPCTDQELANQDIFRLPEPDHYSVAHQLRRDDHLFIDTGVEQWDWHSGAPMVGTLITQGPTRYKDLPVDLKPKIHLAHVIRATTEGQTAIGIAQANVTAQSTAIAENVGDVNGAPLVDLSGPDLAPEEAKRLASIAGTGLERATIQMALADPAAHVVELDLIEPHRFAGERLR